MGKVDLLIRRGTVVDGTGGERRVADVAIGDGKVLEVGDLGSLDAEEVIDAEGLVVAPGFVDTHTHYDAQIFWDPHCTSSGWHGVTSVWMSNCGFGLAPLPNELHERGLQMMTRTEQIAMSTMKVGVPYDWETYPQFLDALRRTPKAVNVSSYFPLNPAMFWVMGVDAVKSRPPNDEEVAHLKALLAEALDAGALGMALSSMGGKNNHTDFDGSQLPIEYLSDDVFCSLAEIVGEKGLGVIQMLVRRGDDAADLAFTERLAAAAGRPVLYNAIGGVEDFIQGGIKAQFEWLDKCVAAGLPIVGQGALIRPWINYTMEDSNHFDNVEVWARATKGDALEKLRLLSDAAIRDEMKRPENYDNVDWTLALYGPQSAIVVDVRGHQNLQKYEGRGIAEIASSEGRHPIDVFLDIVCETKLTAEFRTDIPWGHDPVNVAPIARHPHIAYGLSDGGAHTHSVNLAGWPTEVLTWLVRDTGLVPLEEAHAKLSAFPAKIAGFADRGTLEPGKAADIVVYDFENLQPLPAPLAYMTLHDQPGDEWRRVQKAHGYRYTIVNGQITLIDGEPTGNTPGQLLSPSRP